MLESILATKLYVPRLQPGTVARGRLIERLSGTLHRKLTLISAPAGFGKTTLVSEWLAGNSHPAAWLSLEERDSDPVRFLTYLATAIQAIFPGAGESALAALQSLQPPSPESILTGLLNDIAALQDDFVLVLDDYHAVDSRQVDNALTFLLEHMPPHMHLVMTTREDPHLSIARLRARGQLIELRADDLRFTRPEVAEFLNQAMGLGLTADDIAALETRTEGWIAGLQLAAISLQGHSDTSGFIRSFTGSHRFILDYLTEEVLQRQPDQVRRFLLQTSILNRLSGPLCDAVTGQDGTGALLETLERDNLFVVPLDDERLWFRYHHLFSEVLQLRAAHELANQIPILHQRAGAWHERNGLPSDAIRHAFAAGDVEQAANLIERESLAMLRGRVDEEHHGWLRALPDDVVSKRPVLGVYYALAIVSVDLDAAEPLLRDAERALEKLAAAGDLSDSSPHGIVVVNESTLPSMPGLIAIVRAYRAGALGDFPGAMSYAQRALELLPEDDMLWRGAGGALLGMAHWRNGDLEKAYNTFASGAALLEQTGDTVQVMSGAVILAQIRIAQGRLKEAMDEYERALKLAKQQGDPTPPPTADLYVGMSELCIEHNDLEAGTRYLQKSKELGEHSGISENRHRWCIARARIKETQGDLDGALELLDEAERLFTRSPGPDVRPIAALKARIWIRQGILTRALGWVREQGLSIDDDLSYVREFEHITLARLLNAQYTLEREDASIRDATALLARLQQSAEEGERIGSLIEILILTALAQSALGDVSRAQTALERAITLAEPEGYVRIFVDEGETIAQMLAEASPRGIMPAFASKLLAAFHAADSSGQGSSAHVPAQSGQPRPLIEPLSNRECEVLQLVALGLSNREISERLFLALNTVKGHNRVIFSKLQVQRRTEAVARARELGLV